MFYTVAAVDVVLLVLSVGMRNSATKMTQEDAGMVG
jgi:hypothetical protein